MIALAQLMRHYQADLINRYQSVMQARHYAAMQSIIDCHSPASGELQYHCTPCQQHQSFYHSCGHRSCPACQHQTNNQWLDRQRQKLLPLDYFMVTFTLPYQLRGFVWHHQKWAYQTLFEVAVKTLSGFAHNDQKLGDDLGLTGVLHTHSRQLNFHPHVHFIVPGGGLSKNHRFLKQKTGKYLFNGIALSKVFRGKFIAAMKQQGFSLPPNIPKDWVAQCEYVGKGDSALTYLARYLYRGVISEQNIIKHDSGMVTFQYKDGQSRQWKTRTASAVEFLWLVLQHVLPKGFRRTRDYGFLHGNAKRILQRLQLILKVTMPEIEVKPRKIHSCPCCGFEMQVIQFIRPKPRSLRLTRR